MTMWKNSRDVYSMFEQQNVQRNKVMKINGRYVEGKGQHGHTGENVIWGNLGLCAGAGGYVKIRIEINLKILYNRY